MPVAHRRARSHEVRVRAGTETDLPAVRTIIEAAYQQYERRLGHEAFQRYLTDVLDLDRHRRQGQILVAELHGVICGAVAYYPDAAQQGVGWPEGWASGRGLAVDTPARGMGVAEALVRDVQRRAADDGAPGSPSTPPSSCTVPGRSTTGSGSSAHRGSTPTCATTWVSRLDRPVRTLAYARRLAVVSDSPALVVDLAS